MTCAIVKIQDIPGRPKNRGHFVLWLTSLSYTDFLSLHNIAYKSTSCNYQIIADSLLTYTATNDKIFWWWTQSQGRSTNL